MKSSRKIASSSPSSSFSDSRTQRNRNQLFPAQRSDYVAVGAPLQNHTKRYDFASLPHWNPPPRRRRSATTHWRRSQAAPGTSSSSSSGNEKKAASAAPIGTHEARLDAAKNESFELCCLFFAFHGLSLALLFSAAMSRRRCAGRSWLVPCCVTIATSLVLIGSVQRNVCGYLKLRMKGASFDLSKEPQVARRGRRRSRRGALRWVKRNAVAIGLLCFAGLASCFGAYLWLLH